jgi:hypothetical protein
MDHSTSFCPPIYRPRHGGHGSPSSSIGASVLPGSRWARWSTSTCSRTSANSSTRFRRRTGPCSSPSTTRGYAPPPARRPGDWPFARGNRSSRRSHARSSTRCSRGRRTGDDAIARGTAFSRCAIASSSRLSQRVAGARRLVRTLQTAATPHPARHHPLTHALYRRRTAVERKIGGLKTLWAIDDLRVRGQPRSRPTPTSAS